MVNNNRSVENAWKMMQYLYDELKSRKFKSIDITGIKDLDNLYALVLSRWCASLAKEGMYKEYVTIEGEEMTSPMGQIDVPETISRQTRLRGALVCNYDELSGDINMNHILKGTLQYLLTHVELSEELKKEINKALQAFNGIGYVDINNVKWTGIKFNNSNIRYKHLIEVCKTLVFEHKLLKTLELNDEKRLYLLFKKQLFKWFQETYGQEDTVSTLIKPFTLENESPLEININRVQKMVVISIEKSALIVNVRLQDEHMLDDIRVSRQHKDELVDFIRDYQKETKLKTSGCIIYVNTDKRKLNLQPITVNNVKDVMIGEVIVDIHDQWRFIENKCKDVYTYFIGKDKERNKKGY